MNRATKAAIGTRAEKIEREDHLQIYTADVLRMYAVPDVIWFHVPNQGQHKVQYRVKLKQFGLRAGVSDMAFTLVDCRSAYLELKRHDGTRSKAQIEFGNDCERMGVPYAYVKTCAEVDAFLTTFGIINKPASQPTERPGCVVRGRGAAKVKRSRLPTSARVVA